MRYLIGALFGVVLVLLFFGATTYYHYYQSQRLEDSSQKLLNTKESSSVDSKKDRSNVTGTRASAASGYSNSSSRHNSQRRLDASSSVSSEQKPNLYTWKDKNGNKVISSRPPITGSYEKLTLPEEGLSVVEMEKAKPIRYKKVKRYPHYASSTPSQAVIKQQLISKNKGRCRWLVGRAYERYTKILEHSGANQSVHCDEHSKRVREMYKLAREGDGCYYPYSTPAKC